MSFRFSSQEVVQLYELLGWNLSRAYEKLMWCWVRSTHLRGGAYLIDGLDFACAILGM